jgi:hypothetical protein
MADIGKYLALITSEHQSAPKFMSLVADCVQPFADIIAALAAVPGLYDLDAAQGNQLDIIGQWVGISRQLEEPLPGVYFSWGITGLGWGQGTWFGPYDILSGLVALPDDAYRNLIRAKIAANTWDGTVPGAYTVWNQIFAPEGYQILIQDNQDMTMTIALLGPVPDAVTKALLANGYFDLRPAGVAVTGYFTTSVAGAPLFGFGTENSSIAGWGVGAWLTPIAPTVTSPSIHGDFVSRTVSE